jgi:hypothetical protein
MAPTWSPPERMRSDEKVREWRHGEGRAVPSVSANGRTRARFGPFAPRAAVVSLLLLLVASGGCRAPSESSARTPALASPEPLAGHRESEDGAGRRSAPSVARQTRAGLRVLELGESRIHVALPLELEPGSAALLAWVERCARAVASFYGGFPVPLLELHVRSWAGDGIHGGQALPTSPPTIRIRVGQRTSVDRYERNWNLTHEMVHLAFPNVPPEHHWIEEGLATYVEPIARARTGWITEEAVWAEWIENMPLGLPVVGDGGLDGTTSWGRTYWGGALYCLLVDVEIRKRTQGRHGLPHALRAVLAAGANIAQSWPLERALRTGDRATGTTALIDTYERMKDQPLFVDLDALWKDLGVERRSGRVSFIDSAPLADVRQGIIGQEHHR